MEKPYEISQLLTKRRSLEDWVDHLERWSWYFGIPLVVGCVGEAVLFFTPESRAGARWGTNQWHALLAIMVAVGVAGEVVIAIAQWKSGSKIRELQRTIDADTDAQSDAQRMEVSRLQDLLARASHEQAKLKARADIADAKTELNRRPRHLDHTIITAIETTFPPGYTSGIRVAHNAGDGEARALAMEILGYLKSTGRPVVGDELVQIYAPALQPGLGLSKHGPNEMLLEVGPKTQVF